MSRKRCIEYPGAMYHPCLSGLHPRPLQMVFCRARRPPQAGVLGVNRIGTVSSSPPSDLPDSDSTRRIGIRQAAAWAGAGSRLFLFTAHQGRVTAPAARRAIHQVDVPRKGPPMPKSRPWTEAFQAMPFPASRVSVGSSTGAMKSGYHRIRDVEGGTGDNKKRPGTKAPEHGDHWWLPESLTATPLQSAKSGSSPPSDLSDADSTRRIGIRNTAASGSSHFRSRIDCPSSFAVRMRP